MHRVVQYGFLISDRAKSLGRKVGKRSSTKPKELTFRGDRSRVSQSKALVVAGRMKAFLLLTFRVSSPKKSN